MENQSSKHSWTARFIVGIIILALAFIGLILTNMKAESAWRFWQIATIIIALLALGLSFYLKHMKKIPSASLLRNEILHWLGLIGSVYITSIYVHLGTISSLNGSLVVLTLLAQAIFLAGIYIETTFLFIGIAMGLFAISIAWMETRLFLITVPILVIAILVLAYFVWRKAVFDRPK